MGKRFKFTQQEVTLVDVCVSLAQKAGAQAQNACLLAYLTQGEHEARLLVGYADEAENVMKKPNDDGTFELSRGAVEAIRVGVNVYGEKLQKSEKLDTTLLLGTEDHQTRRDEAQRLAIKLSDDLWTQKEPVVEGAGKGPKQQKSRAGTAMVVDMPRDMIETDYEIVEVDSLPSESERSALPASFDDAPEEEAAADQVGTEHDSEPMPQEEEAPAPYAPEEGQQQEEDAHLQPKNGKRRRFAHAKKAKQ